MKYTKKSPYWEKFEQSSKGKDLNAEENSVPPVFAGDNYYSSGTKNFAIEAAASSRTESGARGDLGVKIKFILPIKRGSLVI